jgi:DNA polymerase elongation subunit (family B)
MLPKQVLQDIKQDANILVTNVQYVRPKKIGDGQYTPDYLYVVYRDILTGKKKLQIITNPTTDVYVTKSEFMDDWKTPRDYVPIEMLDKHTVTYRDREKYLYKQLSDNIKAEPDKMVKMAIDRAMELGKWNGRKEVHKWRHSYFSDYDIEDYVYMTANMYYKPSTFKVTKSFLDIETDVYGSSKHDTESGKCPITAVTIIYDYAIDGAKKYKPKVFTFLLRNYKRYSQQRAFEENLDGFMDKLHKEFDGKYGESDYKIIFFDDEDELLLNVFKIQHLMKPDFTGIWNMSYDILYLQKKLTYLDLSAEAMFCHPDFKNTHMIYHLDERYANDFKNRGDSFNCLSYTKYMDQMLTYAARRKGGQDYGSSGIDNIASIEVKAKKRKYDKPGTTIINAAIEEYENFVLYNINDVWLQVGIERKVEDIDDVFLKGYDSGTRVDKANRQTVSIKNLFILSHFEQGCVMGNNLNADYLTAFGEQADNSAMVSGYDETLKGALVGNPVGINNIGVPIFGAERSTRIFKDCIDLDATAMYPNINLVNNISRSTQHGRLIIPKKVSVLEYSVNPHLRGGEFVDDYETKDYLKVGIKWFGLRRTDDYMKEFVLYRNRTKPKITSKKNDLGGFYKLWSTKMKSVFSRIFPENESLIPSFLKWVFRRDCKDVDCILYNNYENVEYDTTLLSMIDWILDVRPIMTESGTFFKRHEEGRINPGLLTVDGLIKKRKVLKNVELEYEKNGQKEEARIYNLKQNRVKIFNNSIFGVSGAKSSALYSYHVAQSTTSKGQTFIALAMTTFEDFLTDTIQFYDTDELLHFCDNVIGESVHFDDLEILTQNKTISEVRERIARKCQSIANFDVSILNAILENAPQSALNRLYYKSNLFAFLDENESIQHLIRKFSINSPSFLNPNNPPKDGVKHLKKLTNIILEYCQYNYPYYGRVDRLINIKRNSVVVIDTDSNIMCIHEAMNKLNSYMESAKQFQVFQKEGRNRTSEGRRLKSMNTVAFLLTEVITRALDKFKVDTNAEGHPFGTYQMKNEFGIVALLVASGKKRYLGSVILREGEYLWPPKRDIKGFDFKKISAGPKFIREGIEDTLFKHIVTDDISIPEALREFMKMEEKLRESLLSGDKEFLTEAKVKQIDSYKDPMSTGTFKGTYIWNSLYPDKEITLPNSIHLVKIDIKSSKDIADLALTDREMFEKISDLLKEPKMKTGISQIAIPLDEEVPKWIIQKMDIEVMVNKSMGLVTPILEEIGVRPIYKKKSDQYLSNIVSIG